MLDISNGAAYFFSREKPRELEIRTPAATGGLRGTEFHVRVEASGRTQITMFDGEVELSNAAGRILLKSGEQGEVEPGKAPHKTAVLDAEEKALCKALARKSVERLGAGLARLDLGEISKDDATRFAKAVGNHGFADALARLEAK